MKECYSFFSVCVFNDQDQLYQKKEFDSLGSALDYASELYDKYFSNDRIIVYHNLINSLLIKKGSKER